MHPGAHNGQDSGSLTSSGYREGRGDQLPRNPEHKPSQAPSEAGEPQSPFMRFRRVVWGDLHDEDCRRFAVLSLAFLCIVGTYWLARTQKDALFMKITGKVYIPYAKIVSFLLMGPLVLLYSKMADTLERATIFYVVCGVYGIYFLCVAWALRSPVMGLANHTPSPSRLLGWIIYVGIESFGSLMVTMFWSFTNSITDSQQARAGYGLLVWVAQIGSIGGPTLARVYAETWGLPALMALAGITTLLIPVTIRIYVTYFPVQRENRMLLHQTGVVEGLRLVWNHRYLMGILAIATCFEIIGTILDYQMKFQLDGLYSDPTHIAEFMGSFGQWTNLLTLCFSFLGTSFFLRRFGLTACLVAFPASVLLVIMFVWAAPTVTVLFYALVVIRGLSYALNNPCKEILYIPTTDDVKYKAKGWIDMFGARAAKSIGSVINTNLSSTAALQAWTGPIGVVVVAVWIMAALHTGLRHKELVDAQSNNGTTVQPHSFGPPV
eukprot:TRINITY_DN3917_c0_g1_i1.p1 TRINITY_DN3917_c0_g1~~TRINITY_DN3917_c0_g1_i1.p1  ORF type:complete len:499 (+),score=48.05 TRINITY_DN3917_c0_g1_i1:24-1499(+)